MIDHPELARRSLLAFGELLAALGRSSTDPAAELRRPNAIGACLNAVADNPFFDAAIVPVGTMPPNDEARLPSCLWTLEGAAPGRVEVPELATPCMGLVLADLATKVGDLEQHVETPPLAVLGDLNERAYGESGYFTPLVQTLRGDLRVRAHGIRDGEVFVCVVLTFTVGDDVSVHYVATEQSHRRRGLASRLVRRVLTDARQEGRRTATLQASEDGLPVWERLGFVRVATMRGFVRPDHTTAVGSVALTGSG